ncbi:MAG: hypothetical protein OXN17_09305 [Candidatus Poribacteria bacterium]|nr:hypothetical protein [Candidatus Poribacteria bacterium]MDE0504808.1 hypothetical protein [Candidatus Poribacteria bacterium]
MKRPKSHFSIFCTVSMIVGLAASGRADIDNLKFELFGVVNSDDERQIRRRLEPWAEPDGVTFHTPVDKNGRERLFSTLIKVRPRTDDKFSESHTLDTYQILQQLKDQRYRGRPAGSQPWIVKTEAKIKGELFAHPGWARSYIRNVPFWRHWRAQTSVINHAMLAGTWEQKVVFSDSDLFDRLRHDASKTDEEIEVEGVVAGFDGPYPVVSIRSYRLEQESKAQQNESTQESSESGSRKDSMDE